MNETEINEDNCVLDDGELAGIRKTFFMFDEAYPELRSSYRAILFKKITKLNDLVKEEKKCQNK